VEISLGEKGLEEVIPEVLKKSWDACIPHLAAFCENRITAETEDPQSIANPHRRVGRVRHALHYALCYPIPVTARKTL